MVKIMEYIRKFEKENIRTVYLVITRRCNLKCSFCIRGEVDKENDTLSLENIFRYLNEIHNLNSNITLIITGGEATLHPNFKEILQRALELFPKIILCSNGTLFEAFRDNIDIIKKCRVQISIDGNNTYHDLIRGKGSYQKSIKVMKYLISENVDVVSSVTVSKDNIVSLEEMFADLQSIGVKNIKISQEMPGGFAELRTDKQLGYKEWNNLCNKLHNMTLNKDINLMLKKSFPFIGKRLNMNGVVDNALNKAGCKAGITLLYIYPDRKVYGCPLLMEYPLLELDKFVLNDLETSYYSNILYDYCVSLESTCSQCAYKEICRSGCPGRRKYTNKLWDGDSTCPLIQEG